MMKNVLQWYEGVCDSWKQNESHFESDTLAMSKISEANRSYVTVGNTRYFVKTPHSRRFKFGCVKLGSACRDNFLSTTSELVSQKKFKELDFFTAQYKPIMRSSLKSAVSKNEQGLSESFVLVSPILISNQNMHTATIHALQEQEHLLFPDTQMDSIMFNDLETALENKDYFLQFMTENCYDEYIEYILASIFDFTDDDHLGNIILWHPKDSHRFEHLLVHDKESTAFNPMVAEGYSYQDVKKGIWGFSHYNGVPIKRKDENSADRVMEVTRLVASGKLPKKYCEFLNRIAGLDYQKFAKEVCTETGLVPSQKQIDMYQFGAECAGEIVIKEM